MLSPRDDFKLFGDFANSGEIKALFERAGTAKRSSFNFAVADFLSSADGAVELHAPF
ncbi:MAG: hypothetical protein WA510_09000 [Acidobacteriaceae bacterium]